MSLLSYLDPVHEMARRAGEAILKIYEDVDPGVTYKDDESPLTRADLAANEILTAGLKELTPKIPILSEEGRDIPYEERSEWQHFWLVDPLDGTKEFIKKNGEFTVNVALIEDGEPVLGVVHAPVLDRTYLAVEGHGARKAEGGKPGRPILAKGTGSGELAVVASRSHAGDKLKGFLEHFPEHRLVSMGSSLKICLVADGSADIYPRLGPTMEWDTAAAHAVVLAAGGQVLNAQNGAPLAYNKENLLNPHFIVVGNREVAWKEALGLPV